jgi:flagellin
MAGIGRVNYANRYLDSITRENQRTSQILATGSNFPNASYGSASYAIFHRMNSHIGAIGQSIQNTQNASAMIKTAAGATGKTVDALTSIQQYLVQAANGTNTDTDRAAIQENINQLVKQIDDNAHIEYNEMNLLDGSRSNIMIAGVTGYESLELGNMSAQALGLMDDQGNITIDVSNDEAIQKSLRTVTGALDYVRGINDNLNETLQRDDILGYSLDEATEQGVQLQALEIKADNLTTMEENLQAAASTLGDADMAKQAVRFSLQKIQQQVDIEVAKIFNRSQESVLKMLQ